MSILIIETVSTNLNYTLTPINTASRLRTMLKDYNVPTCDFDVTHKTSNLSESTYNNGLRYQPRPFTSNESKQDFPLVCLQGNQDRNQSFIDISVPPYTPERRFIRRYECGCDRMG